MAKGIVAAGVLIFKAGFIAGLFFGIGLAFGVPLDKIGVTNFILETFCELNLLDNDMIQYNCDELVIWVGILSVVLLVVSIIVTIMIMGHWLIGLIIYGAGWGIGYYVSTLVL